MGEGHRLYHLLTARRGPLPEIELSRNVEGRNCRNQELSRAWRWGWGMGRWQQSQIDRWAEGLPVSDLVGNHCRVESVRHQARLVCKL